MTKVLKEDLDIIISEELPWDTLKNSSFLITGAAGMIGSYFVNTLLNLNKSKGMNIKIFALEMDLTKFSEDILENKDVTIITQDVTNVINIEEKIDYIIHTAGPASPKIIKENPVGTIAANVIGTYNTLELARKNNSKGYLFISSREIYGQPYPNQELFTENDYGLVNPLDPRSSYPEGKKASETMCASYKEQYNLNVKIARLAHTYGPGMSIYDGRVQADFLKNVLFNEDIVLKSDGSSIRTYTYIRDAIIAMFYLLLNSKDIVYNIGDEKSKVSIKELAETMLKLKPEKNLKLVFDIPEKNKYVGQAPFTLGILDSTKLRKEGWSPKVSILDGFQRTLNHVEEELNIK